MHKSDFWQGFWGSDFEKQKKGIDSNQVVIDKKVDYYAELGVSENATEEEIRQGFRHEMDAMPIQWTTYGNAPMMTNAYWNIYVRLDKALRVLTERRAEYDKARKQYLFEIEQGIRDEGYETPLEIEEQEESFWTETRTRICYWCFLSFAFFGSFILVWIADSRREEEFHYSEMHRNSQSVLVGRGLAGNSRGAATRRLR